jgi:hypothetical protein
MKELEKAALDNGVKPGAQLSRFLMWVGNECFEGREAADLAGLARRGPQLAARFLEDDSKEQSR